MYVQKISQKMLKIIIYNEIIIVKALDFVFEIIAESVRWEYDV